MCVCVCVCVCACAFACVCLRVCVRWSFSVPEADANTSVFRFGPIRHPTGLSLISPATRSCSCARQARDHPFRSKTGHLATAIITRSRREREML
ncbi:hypothetical protein GGR52DRAFT_466593 [Hypoxylon sp. FL1284]|nr:hypothetical protein GGR52DRAFT_466593 [Hypoxylon sp. FL1284]